MATVLASYAPPSIVTFTEMATTLSELHQAHAQMLKTGLIRHNFAASRIISSFAATTSDPQALSYAHSIFSRIPTATANSFIFNTMIRVYANSPTPEQALLFFLLMLRSPILPDKFTFPFVLKACSSLLRIRLGQQIHALILKTGFGFDVFVQNTLIHFYATAGYIGHAKNLLDRMIGRNVISWNAIISACVGQGLIEQGRHFFDKMSERNVESWNFMISGYVSLGLVEEARCLFDETPLRDVVSWNAMITGYAHEGRFWEVLILFEDMQNAKVKPDDYTLVNVLSACSNLGALSLGEWVRTYINKNGIKIDGFLATALVDMYSKCGRIEKALQVFGDTSRKDVSTWNSIISGLSIHGYGKLALTTLSEMLENGLAPNEVTFISVLSACSRSGLLDEGRLVFDLMVRVHGIQPSVEHYGCMVDLLGRAGLLEEAEELVKTVPLKEALAIWESLLSACRSHGNVELGERVAKKILDLNPQDSASYVQLSNIYASVGRWNDVREVRSKMRMHRVRKEPGCSMIEVDGVVHEFLSVDGLHQ